MWSNKLKQKMAAGEVAYGPFVRMPGPVSVELAASAGFDFVIICQEHSALDMETTEAMILGALACGITPVVRVPEANGANIHRVLDIGAHAVMVPMCNTAADAKVVGDNAKFGSFGRRGVAGFSRGDSWGALPVDQAIVNMHEEVLTVVQIETVEALSNVDAIAATPGVDIVFIGPLDLSTALGVPGQVGHPKVIEAANRVVAAAEKHGKQVGIYCGTAEDSLFWAERGIKMISSGLDTILLQRAYADLRKVLPNGLGKQPNASY